MALQKYMMDRKEDIKNIEVKPRATELSPSKNFITAVIGPRRAGKTYSLYEFIQKNRLNDDEYLFVNMEDYEVKTSGRENVAQCVAIHTETYGCEPAYIFLDEVQGMEKWNNWVYSLYEKKRYNIVVTGSTSKHLSKEIATELRGRTITVRIFPFSFKEFLTIMGFDLKKNYTTNEEAKIRNLLRTYLKSGGYPDVLLGHIQPEKFFREYIDLTTYRDIVERYEIKNLFLIKFMINSVISSYSSEFSINKIYNSLKANHIKVSRKTLYTYFTYLYDAMFVFPLRKYSRSLRKMMLARPKIYINDTGIINSITPSGSEEIGRMMENTVFLELERRKDAMPLMESYYWKDASGREVDFVVKEGNNIKELIQVSYAEGRDGVESREIDNLLIADIELKARKLTVITWSYEGTVEFGKKTIHFIPLWKWLLL
ncbi:MAG: ATP-binding protein [Thermoplasmata archaeon]